METAKVESIFSDFSGKSDTVKRYREYWESVTPQTEGDIFRRWLFAFTSIHTTWEGNVRGYNAIKDYDKWLGDKEALLKLLIESRSGMHNVRTENIHTFAADYWQNPKAFGRGENESHVDWRNRLTKTTKGIGLAKVSFTLEMIAPNEAEVVCLDTHMIQLYELGILSATSKRDVEIYHKAEADWIARSQDAEIPAYIARCLFWDENQNKQDSRYWSVVLE